MGCVHAYSIRIVSRVEDLACDVLIIAENTESCMQDLDSYAKILNNALTILYQFCKRMSKLDIVSYPSPR